MAQEKHVTCARFENAAPRTKTNAIANVHFTDDDVNFYYGPGMLIRKTAKPCINSSLIALLIHGAVLVKALAVNSVRHSYLCNNFRCNITVPFEPRQSIAIDL